MVDSTASSSSVIGGSKGTTYYYYYYYRIRITTYLLELLGDRRLEGNELLNLLLTPCYLRLLHIVRGYRSSAGLFVFAVPRTALFPRKGNYIGNKL